MDVTAVLAEQAAVAANAGLRGDDAISDVCGMAVYAAYAARAALAAEEEPVVQAE